MNVRKSDDLRTIANCDVQKIQIQMASLSEADWESHEANIDFFQHDGKRCFYLDAFIEMVTTEDHWDLQVTVLEPGETFRYEEDEVPTKRRRTTSSKRREHFDCKLDANYPYKTLFRAKKSIWDKFCSNDIGSGYVAVSAPAIKIPRKPHITNYAPPTMRTRQQDLYTQPLTVDESAEDIEEDVVINTPMNGDVVPSVVYRSSSNFLRDIAPTSSSKRALSGKMGVKAENTRKKREFDDRYWRSKLAGAGSATPTPSTSHGLESVPGLGTSSLDTQKSQQLEQFPGSSVPNLAALRLAALHNDNPTGMSAAEYYGS